MADELRMNAYYYSFEKTGVPEIDKILSAVACAGKAFHHTDSWGDESEWPPHKGKTPLEWIQNAANEAATAFKPVIYQLHGEQAEREIDRLRNEISR